MKLCIPVNEDQGADSTVCEHFGSAPLFMLVDTDTMDIKTVVNSNQHHSHGMCQPLKALDGEKFDGIVVGGIGSGALMKLEAANIKVFRTSRKAVRDTVEAFKRNELQLVTPTMACGHNHGDSHQHRHRNGQK